MLRSDGEFLTTEYSQQVVDNVQRADGPPSVVPSLCETVYRWDNSTREPDAIQAAQKVVSGVHDLNIGLVLSVVETGLVPSILQVYIYNKVLSEQSLNKMDFIS